MDALIDQGCMVSTRANYSAQLKQFVLWAAERGLLDESLVKALPRIKVPQGMPRPIGEDDLKLALMTAAQPVRAWLVLGAYCGLRAGEIANLRREHLLDDHRPPVLMVVDGKGGKTRGVPMSETVLAELGPFLTARRGRLWLAGSSNPSAAVTKRVRTHLVSLGLPFSCHSLRHRFATQVYQRSRDLRMTQDLLGHATPATTQVYAQWDFRAGASVLDELGDDLRAAPVLVPDKPARRP
ncbi:tyrosine-type recombinase/integrase [Pseudonocardia benzenivorans]